MKKSKKEKTVVTLDPKELYKMLGQMMAIEHQKTKKYVKEWGTAIYCKEFVLMCLLSIVLEKLGVNPLEECSALLLYQVYQHGTMTSAVDGLRVENGKVIDPSGQEVPGYEEMYEAKEKGIAFGDAYNASVKR